jgi:hypothetical protein
MVTLDYSFDPKELDKLTTFDFGQLTLTDLDFYLFCGNILFSVDGVSFDAAWEWIPILNFCVRMNLVLADLNIQGRALLEFTENEATILFQMDNASVTITADYAHASARAGLQQLRDAVKDFSARLIHDLAERCPVLLTKSVFQERLDIIRSTSGEVLPA